MALDSSLFITLSLVPHTGYKRFYILVPRDCQPSNAAILSSIYIGLSCNSLLFLLYFFNIELFYDLGNDMAISMDEGCFH